MKPTTFQELTLPDPGSSVAPTLGHPQPAKSHAFDQLRPLDNHGSLHPLVPLATGTDALGQALQNGALRGWRSADSDTF